MNKTIISLNNKPTACVGKNTSFFQLWVFIFRLVVSQQQKLRVFRAWLRLRTFLFGEILMFEDVEHIESMSYDEYRQALYWLRNRDEYPGDYQLFLEKILDYGSKNDRGWQPRYE